jgi:excisionase family DNA binding protein
MAWNNYLDVKELAEALGYTPQNITRLVRKGEIAFIKKGRKYYFERSVVDAYIQKSTGNVELS